MSEVYDVIVVGAGPAGSSTAYNCVQKGLKVLLVDQRKKVGTPKQCAEGINKEIITELGLKLKPEWVSRKIESLILSDINNYIVLKGKRTQGFILERKVFDHALAERARKAGAELLLGEKVVDLKSNKVVLKSKKEIAGKVIVGADGPLSIIGKKSGLGNPKNGCGLQYEIKTQKNDHLNSLQCYLNKNLEDAGYFWVFPKKETLNVGVGSKNFKNLKPALDKFVKELGLEKEKVQEINAGHIPLHGPVKKFYTKNVLLVGDAAGHTNPISGGGIPVAIYDGILAAEVIEKNLRSGYELSNYQKLWWKSNFGQAVKVSLKIQNIYFKLFKKNMFTVFLKKMNKKKVNSVKEFALLGLKIPGTINKLMMFQLFFRFMKYYKYAW